MRSVLLLHVCGSIFRRCSTPISSQAFDVIQRSDEMKSETTSHPRVMGTTNGDVTAKSVTDSKVAIGSASAGAAAVQTAHEQNGVAASPAQADAGHAQVVAGGDDDASQTDKTARLKYRWKATRGLPGHVLVVHLKLPNSQVGGHCCPVTCSSFISRCRTHR